jgi:hypothetical protein
LDYCQSLLNGGDKDTTNIWFHQTPPTKKSYQQFSVVSKIVRTFRGRLREGVYWNSEFPPFQQ